MESTQRLGVTKEAGNATMVGSNVLAGDPADRAYLIHVMSRDGGRAYPVGEETVIGRDPQSDVVISGDDVSRRHARIQKTSPGVFEIEDLGSRNGTLVNGLPVTRQVLSFGDKVQVGVRTILIFAQHNPLESQLLQLQKMESMGRLAGGIAHDFNNLVGVILANVSFLGSRACACGRVDEELQQSLQDIEMAARRAEELTRGLLGFARMGKSHTAPVDVKQLIDDVVRLLRRTVDRRIRIDADVRRNLRVAGDRSQLQQVMVNLCINARDAMPDGGTLTIRTDRLDLDANRAFELSVLGPGRYVRISVEDTGRGMDQATLDRVFEPFFTTKGPHKGTGLGLATVYGIVRNHGGQVQAASEPGKGATFTVYLPLIEDTSAGALGTVATGNRGKAVAVAGGRILLVDDEAGIRRGAARLLSGLGYEVVTARGGQEAVGLLRKDPGEIRLVLLDLIMPQLSGAETFHLLRSIRPDLRVLLISGYSDPQQVRDLLDAGAVGFLKKPFDARTLQGAISEALGAPLPC